MSQDVRRSADEALDDSWEKEAYEEMVKQRRLEDKHRLVEELRSWEEHRTRGGEAYREIENPQRLEEQHEREEEEMEKQRRLEEEQRTRKERRTREEWCTWQERRRREEEDEEMAKQRRLVDKRRLVRDMRRWEEQRRWKEQHRGEEEGCKEIEKPHRMAELREQEEQCRREEEDHKRMVKRSWLEEEQERLYTQRVEDLRTAQRMQSIIERDMLLKDQPGPERRASDLEGVLGGQNRDRSGQTPVGNPSESLPSGTMWRNGVHLKHQRSQEQALPEITAQPGVEGPSDRAPASKEELDLLGNKGRCCSCHSRCLIM